MRGGARTRRGARAGIFGLAIAAACSTSPPAEQPSVASSFHADADGFAAADGEWTAHVARNGTISVAAKSRGTTSGPLLIASTSGGEASLARGGAVARTRTDSSAVERITSTHDGVSQAWYVASAPPGPFIVRVHVTGLAYAGRSETGHHFVDRATGLGLRYGRATWIGADGARTPIDTERDGEDLVMTVSAAAVAATSYPAMLDPIIGPELSVDTPILATRGPSTDPMVAPGPSATFLVAWSDASPGAPTDYYAFAKGALLAARVDDKGAALGDLVLLPVPSKGAHVAYDATSQRWLFVGIDADFRVVGARVDATGKLLDEEPFVVLTNAQGYGSVSVAAADGKFFVAGSAGYVSAAYVAAAGASPVGPKITTNARTLGVAAACDSAACTAFSNYSNVGATRIAKNGTVLDATPLVVKSGGDAVDAVTFDGTSYLVLTRSYGTLTSTRFSPSGSAVGSPATVATNGNVASMSWNGTHHVATWSDGSDIYARRIATDDTMVDGAPVAISTHPSKQITPSLAWSGTQHLVAWSDDRYANATVSATRVDTSLAAADANGVLLTRGTNAQRMPSAAFDGSTYLLAWMDDRSGADELYTARLSAAGALVGSPVSLGPTACSPAVATDGSVFLVTWCSGTSVLATRISPASGAALDQPALTLATTFSANNYYFQLRRVGPAVSYDGTSFVVVWTDARFDALSSQDIVAARVSPAGTVLDPNGIVVSTAVDSQLEPAVAGNGAGSFVAWADARSEFYEGTDIYGTRLSSAGEVLDPNGVVVALEGGSQATPAVAWSGKDWLVAWIDTRRAAFGGSDVYFTRVGTNGVSVTPGGTLVAKSRDAHWPAVVATGDGKRDLLAWEDGGALGVIRGAWIEGSTLLDPGGLVVIGGDGSARTPSAARGPAAGKVALFHSRFRLADGGLGVVGRIASAGSSTGTACTTRGDCDSRFCADAVCCDEACDAPCKHCGAGGKCTAVTQGEDGDACSGASRCDASGECKKKEGVSCAFAAECASGFCADGFCCNRACDGSCESCSATPGVCGVVSRGALGRPSCSPRVCDGANPQCPNRCLADDDCAGGFGCDRPTGACIAGNVCVDANTSRAPDGTKTDCRPYACASGSCATSCKSVGDCAFPAACNEDGRCIVPDAADSGSGCRVAGGSRGSSWEWLLAFALLFRRRRAAS